MSKKQRNEVLVGGFIAAAAALFVLLLFLMGTVSRLFSPVSVVRVVFSDIRGLKCGDPVSFLGSKVGLVSAVEFERRRWGEDAPDLFPEEKGESTKVMISLRIRRKAAAYLRKDSPVEIDKNLTGNLNVLIREGSAERLGPADVLRGRPGADIAVIADRIDGMLKRAEPAVEDLVAVARRLAASENIEQAVEDLAVLVRRVRDGVGPIQDAVGEAVDEARAMIAENRADVRSIASNLAGGSELLRKVLEKVEPASGEIGPALARIEEAAAAAAGVLQGNRPGIDAIVEEAREALANAANLTADIRRRPWRLLYRPADRELQGLDLYDAAWAYNLGAAELGRRLDRLTVALGGGPGSPRPEVLDAAIHEVEESLRRHKDAEDAFWRRLKESR